MSKKWFVLVLLLGLLLEVSYANVSSVYVVNYDTSDGLATGVPVCVNIDPSGWVWVGTASTEDSGGGGFTVINRNRYFLSYGKSKELGGKNVFDILFDNHRKAIWFATSCGVYRWDGVTGKWQNYTSDNSGLTENKVNTLYIDKNGNLYIGTHGGGLFKIKKGENKITSLKCPLKHITGIVMDEKGRLWVSSWEGAAYRQEGVWVTYTKENSNLSTNRLEDISKSFEGKILCASEKGLLIFDGVSWSTMDTSNSSLLLDHVSNIYIDKKGDLWFSTWGGGITHLDKYLEFVKNYSRKNSLIDDNRISSLAMDEYGNLWVCTRRGVSYVYIKEIPKDEDRIYTTSTFGYMWRNTEGKSLCHFEMSLPRSHYGDVLWSWSAFISGKGFDVLEPDVTVQEDVYGNAWLNVSTPSDEVGYIQTAYITSKTNNVEFFDRDKVFPFPKEFPKEVQIYLRSSADIPSNESKIRQEADKLVQKSSKGCMLKTAQDILCSSLFANMERDVEKEEAIKKGAYISDIKKWYRSACSVLEENKGTSYEKNRLACALLRAEGIPARLVMSNEFEVWGEVYINGLGWVPFNVASPVYLFYGNMADERASVPYILRRDYSNVSISTSSDNLKGFLWSLPVKSRFQAGKDVYKKISSVDIVKKCQVLLIKPSKREILPRWVKVPVSYSMAMTIREEGGVYNLKFYDAKNRFFKYVPITHFGRAMHIDLDGRATFTIIPEKMGDFIVLRMLEWKVLDKE